VSAVQYNPDEDLKTFGYQQQLRRSIGGYSSFALAFSMISITTCIFTLFAQPFQTIGGVAIWLWVLATAGILVIAAVYGHLAARLPVTGYAYQWSSRLVNPHYGWFTGWNALLATLFGSASIAIAFGTVFAPDFWATPSHGDVILLASIATVAAVSVNIVSIRLTARINDVGASVELFGTLGLTALLGIGLLFFHHIAGPGVVTQVKSSTGGQVNLTTIGLALLLPVYTLLGWEGSADLAEETTDPRGMAPKAMIRSCLVSGIAGFVVFAIFAMAIPGNLNTTVNSTTFNPVIHIFSVHFGGAGSDALQVVAFIAVFSCLLANITVATRTGFSLSRDNMLPISRIWSRVHPTTRTPVVTIIAVGLITVGVNFLSSGEAARVVAIVAVVCMITYATSMIAVLIAKRRAGLPEAGPGRFDLGRWLVPMAITGLGWSIVVILFMTVPTVNHAAGEYTIYFELAGVVWYVAALRRRLRLGQAGPYRDQPGAADVTPVASADPGR
jgi:amino acid transporter